MNSWRLTRGQVVTFMLGMALTAVLVAVVTAVLTTAETADQIQATQLEGTPTGKKLLASADRILDCTDPGGDGKPAGKCYKRNQERTADLVGQLVNGNIIAVVCALNVQDGTPTSEALEEVTACVGARLSQP